jgi:6-phosphofructokinase 2
MIPILTITCNPAIDKSTSVEALVPEKKLRCKAPKFEPGGGGVNVARAIHKLGGQATAIYPAGGHTGQFFNSLLEKEGFETIPVEINSFTRENLIVLDESSGLQYRFGMPGSTVTAKEWQACLDAIDSRQFEYLVFSGSLPPGMPAGMIVELAALCKSHGARMIADTSGPALKSAAETGVFLLKPNLGELAGLAGKDQLTREEIIPLCRAWIRNGAAEIFVVSMGKEGAMLITETESFSSKPPEVKIRSTVGAGDSMVAGIVLSLAQGKDFRESLQYGVCCGTAATLNPGTGLCRREDVISLLKMLPQA